MSDTLDAWILADNKIVTYRLLSRLQTISVNSAKDLLETWHKQNPSTHATYVISGYLPAQASSQTGRSALVFSSFEDRPSEVVSPTPGVRRRRVQLVAEEELTEVKAQYESVKSCHIYSIEPAKLTDISLIVACRDDIQECMKGQSNTSFDLATRYGIIENTCLREFDNSRTIEPVKPTIHKRESKTSEDQKLNRTNKVESSHGGLVKDVLPQTLAKVGSQTQNLTKSKSSLSKAKDTIRLEATVNDAANAKTTIEKPAQSERPLKRKQEPVELDLFPEDEEDFEQAKPLEATSDQRTRLDDDQATAEPKAASFEPTDVVRDNPPAHDPESSTAQQKEVRRFKKKVKRQVSTMDAKGYLVTEEVTEWISCDEEEIENAAPKSKVIKAKPAPALMKKTSKGGAKDIASFFKKR